MKDYRISFKEAQLLDILSSQGAFSAKALGKQLAVSSRTILNYIEHLNVVLTQGVGKIESTTDRKYVLDIADKRGLRNLLSQLKGTVKGGSGDRTPELIKLCIEATEKLVLEELAEQLYVSRSTLVKDLKKAGDVLRQYHLYIKSKPNEGISVVGNEMNKRFCLYQEFYRQDLGFEAEGNKELFLKLERCVMEGYQKAEGRLSVMAKKMIIPNLVVAALRIRTGNLIKELPEKVVNIDDTREYRLAAYIAKAFERAFGQALPYCEVVYIGILLMGLKPIDDFYTYEEMPKTMPPAKRIVCAMLEAIHHQTGFYMKDDEELIKGLELHTTYAINRLLFNMIIENPLAADVRKKLPLPYQLAKTAAVELEKYLGIGVNEHELSYLAMHFSCYIERNKYRYKDIDRVGLVCGTGMGTAQLMKVKIRNTIGEACQINTFSASSLRAGDLEGYDIVFTTVDLNIACTAPVIRVDVLFDERELRERIAYRRIKQAISNDSIKTFRMILKKDLYFKIDAKKSQSVIEFMARRCTEHGVADEGFKERILEREKMASTGFDNLIALPHTLNAKSNQIEVAVGVLNKPVNWGDKLVQLVFMVLIPESQDTDSDLFIKIYSDILSIGQNLKLVEQLIQANGFEAFVEAL